MASPQQMGQAPVKKILISLALPQMISLLVQSLYNIVDSIFVSRIGENALAATSLAYPFQMLMIALGVGTAVGINATLSRLLGAGKTKEVSSAAVHGIFLAVFGGFLFIIVGLFAGPLAHMMTENDETAELCRQYLSIVCILSMANLIAMMFQRFLQSTGRAALSMISLMSGAILNIILDPIMIFGLCGCPAMGIAGAAYATVLGQLLMAVTAILLNHYKNPEVKLTLKGFRWNWSIVAMIYKVGFPTIIMQSMQSIMNFGMNGMLITCSETAVAFFGVYYKLQNFLFMPISGLGQGAIPLMGFNYGAGNGKRMREILKYGLIYGCGIAVCATILFLALPGVFLSMFDAGTEMLAIGVPAIRIIAATFVFCAVTTILGYSASGMGDGVTNMVGTGLRQVVLLLPLVWILLKTAGINYVWYAFWIAEIAAAVFCIFSVKRNINKKILPLERKV